MRGTIVAVDIGGTFTDSAAIDRTTGRLSFAKTLNTPPRLESESLDILYRRLPPFVPRHLRFEAKERIEAVAICFLHAWSNPSHEIAAQVAIGRSPKWQPMS
ncbi:MAG: hypothetical protein ACKVQU_23810 [Burkholderiales bacterium]